MRTAFCTVLALALAAPAQDPKPEEKKPDKVEKITPENIEVGKVGTIDRLIVESADQTPGSAWIIANFGTVRVLIEGVSSVGVGRGKVLSKDQAWKVDHVVTADATGSGLKGCYVLKPHDPKKK